MQKESLKEVIEWLEFQRAEHEMHALKVERRREWSNALWYRENVRSLNCVLSRFLRPQLEAMERKEGRRKKEEGRRKIRMKFHEAMKLLDEGVCVRRSWWYKERFLEKGSKSVLSVDDYGCEQYYTPSTDDIFAEDWEVYQEETDKNE